MPQPRNDRRPGGQTEPPSRNTALHRANGKKDESAVDSVTRLGGLDAVAAAIDGAFVLVVETTDAKVRRRCFLSAKAAENAARRATGRGESAKVYLAELKPLWKLTGGEGR